MILWLDAEFYIISDSGTIHLPSQSMSTFCDGLCGQLGYIWTQQRHMPLSESGREFLGRLNWGCSGATLPLMGSWDVTKSESKTMVLSLAWLPLLCAGKCIHPPSCCYRCCRHSLPLMTLKEPSRPSGPDWDQWGIWVFCSFHHAKTCC